LSVSQPSFPTALPPHEGSALALRTILLLVPLLALTAPVFWFFAQTPETPVSLGTWSVVVLSALANLIVIAYHYAVPAHPKFLMVPWRRMVLRVHILSGTVELVSGLITCFTGNVTAAVVMGVAALFFHVPSAFFQTRIVFGSKAIMVPSYLLCIITHGFCAGMLLAHPDSRMWAVNTFLVFNIYVWCRIYFYVFDALKLFASAKYSISILAAGATMIPALFGPMGFMLLAGFVGAYVLLYRLIFVRNAAEYNDFVREKARDSAANADYSRLWSGQGLSAEQSEAMARDCFERLDPARNGELDRVTVMRALTPWGLPAAAIQSYAEKLCAAGPVDFARFRREIWSIGAVRQHALLSLSVERAATDRERAELVFRHLDADGDGFIEAQDLDLLLIEWGLPASETKLYLTRIRTDAQGRIGFAEFLRTMEPVWRYIYHEVFQPVAAAHDSEMIGRGVRAASEARRADALREHIKRDLLARVPFLKDATENLIAVLAASLVTEKHPAGGVVFQENSPGAKFYLIASGLVRVSKHGEPLTTLGSGACFGEGSLITNQPRSATITAAEDSVLFSLTRAAFEHLTESYPAVRARLHELHETRRIDTTTHSLEKRLARHLPFLQRADSAVLVADLARHLRPVHCARGEFLLREGDPGDCFYIVENGSLAISRRGESLATIGTGGCVGEGALLDAGPRRASARALEDCSLLSLNREVFQQLLAQYPTVRANLTDLHHSRSNPGLPIGDSRPPAMTGT
jgi:CRP-like cAMP-binding protein/Ca2+-binding EF-hand superfamily protein